jgi:hypothetical protein
MFIRVMLRRQMRMLLGMSQMSMSNVRMMRSPEVIARFMMLRGFRMVVCSQPVMMSSLFVMFFSLFGHWGDLHSRSQTLSSCLSASTNGIIPDQADRMCNRRFN